MNNIYLFDLKINLLADLIFFAVIKVEKRKSVTNLKCVVCQMVLEILCLLDICCIRMTNVWMLICVNYVIVKK